MDRVKILKEMFKKYTPFWQNSFFRLPHLSFIYKVFKAF